MPTCAVCLMKVSREVKFRTEIKKRTYYFCSSRCLMQFQKTPEKYSPVHIRTPAFVGIPSRVHLSQSAFTALILSVAEIFKKEAMGYLLGNCKGEVVEIDHAIPFQTGKRGYTYSAVSLRRLEWVRDLTERIHPGLQWIGDYHSHPQHGNVLRLHLPSILDVEDMEPGYVYLVISVNEVQVCLPWRTSRKRGTLAGTLGKLRMEIAGYCLDKEQNLRRLEVDAPWLKRK